MIHYEWELCEVDEAGDVVDVDGDIDLRVEIARNRDLLTGVGSTRLRLIAAEGDEFSSNGFDEAWVVEGRLPDHMEDGLRVPGRFHRALAAAIAASDPEGVA